MGFFRRVADWFNRIYTDGNPVNTLDFLDGGDHEPTSRQVRESSFERPPDGIRPQKEDELPVCELTGLRPTFRGEPCEFAELYTGPDGRTARVCSCYDMMMRISGNPEIEFGGMQLCLREAGIQCVGFSKGNHGEAIPNPRGLYKIER